MKYFNSRTMVFRVGEIRNKVYVGGVVIQDKTHGAVLGSAKFSNL